MIRIDALDAHDDAAFAAFHGVYETADDVDGRLPRLMSLPELRPMFVRTSAAQLRQGWCAYDGAELVGIADVEFPLADNLNLVHAGAYVLPDRRREGIGSALIRHVDEVARDNGRVTRQCWVTGRAAGHPEDHRTAGERFAEALGMTCRLLDAERMLDLPVDQVVLDRLAAEAAPHRAGYRLVSWERRCPEEHRVAYVRLKGSMVDEAPAGELEQESEIWDDQRLADLEDEITEMGRTMYVVAAIARDGSMAGHNELTVPEYDPGRVYQWDTLVAPDHRGHRLGLAMKVANLDVVQRRHPDRTLLRTWNAVSNTPMIAVNDAMGFRLAGYTGEWQGPIQPA